MKTYNPFALVPTLLPMLSILGCLLHAGQDPAPPPAGNGILGTQGAASEGPVSSQSLPPQSVVMTQTLRRSGGGGSSGTTVATSGASQNDSYSALHPAASSASALNCLVLPAQEPDPKWMLEMEEDLTVMARLLEKKAGLGDQDSPLFASGIRLLLTPSGTQGPRNVYLEGYGALFLLSVGFPLAPQERDTESTPEAKTSTAWEEAKRDLYGNGMGFHLDGHGLQMRWGPEESREEYDPEKVEQLKADVVKALREATNMRHVKSEELVTIVITSAGPNAGRRTFGLSTGVALPSSSPYGAMTVSQRSSKEHTLIIRARKMDIDAVASGELSTEEFQDTVTVLSF